MENEALLKKYSDGHRHSRLASHAEEFSDVLMHTLWKDLVVLDVGCGRWRDVGIFANHFPVAIGIDNDSQLIGEVKRNTSNGWNFFVMDAEDIKFPGESIDAVFCINVLHYVKQDIVIRHILRVLQKWWYAFLQFNLHIIDNNGNEDYSQSENEINNLLRWFKLVQRKIFDRQDVEPNIHTHHILQLILKKE